MFWGLRFFLQYFSILDRNIPPQNELQKYFFQFIFLSVQGYPQRIRLQRRLYVICLVRFLACSGFLVEQNCLFPVLNQHLIESRSQKSSLKRHIFRVLGRLYSLCGYPGTTYPWTKIICSRNKSNITHIPEFCGPRCI